MASNRLGQIFSVTSFGESHGPAVGVVIDGCPAGIAVDEDFIRQQLMRRRPGQSAITTARNETEEFTIVSGVFEGHTTGAPICILIPNKDSRPADYDSFKDIFRPSHADFTYQVKYGIRDHRGGGRSSARATAGWVAAGALARLCLKPYELQFNAWVSQIGPVKSDLPYEALDFSKIESSVVRCPDPEASGKMINYLEQLKAEGDSTGGIISCVIKNCPAGLGEPVFDKLHANLGKAMLSINAVKGFEYGSGFEGAAMKGSQHNDPFRGEQGKISTVTNFSGGIQGGISTGNDIFFRVAFKPVATIKKEQRSVSVVGDEVNIQLDGRHDPCVVPRAVPIVEAMAAIILADHVLISKAGKNS